MTKSHKYKILTEDEKRGNWIDRSEFIDLMRMAYHRNRQIYGWLKGIYEYLENEKFDESLIDKNKKSNKRRIKN